MTTKVLNLYAGIGGNRKLWDKVEDIDVTAVEWDKDKAQVYRDHFPNDDVIVTDAHEYLLENFRDYDFIWASPPCPTHSTIRKNSNPNNVVYPDMEIYQEILLLKHYYNGDWVVENVDPYYEPLIEGVKRGRHMFWSNYHIPPISGLKNGGTTWLTDDQQTGQGREACFELGERYGYDLSSYEFNTKFLRKIVSNCVNPKLGKHAFASRGKQTTLFQQ